MIPRWLIQLSIVFVLTVGSFAVTSFGTAVTGVIAPAAAAEPAKTSSGWLQIPKPPKGKGDKCVADTEYMRRNHMKMLMHQRDDTVHNGVRTKQFSLNGCISCHAVTEPGAKKPVTIKSPKHFCRSCHDYVAVKVDCFQCHASRPDVTEKTGKAAGLLGPAVIPGSGSSHKFAQKGESGAAAALADYVRSATK